MSTSNRVAFVCGVFAATSASLALFAIFSRRRETSERAADTANDRVSAIRDIDAAMLSAVPQVPPPAYMPPPAAPPVYFITAPTVPVVQHYAPAPPPRMDPPPPPNPVRPLATVIPSLQRVNDLQLLVHQQQNIFTDLWEEHSPRKLATEDIAFVILSRTQRIPLVPAKIYLLEIYSDALKRVLTKCNCMKYVESVHDVRPQVPPIQARLIVDIRA